MAKFEEINEGLGTIIERLIKSSSDFCIKDIFKRREEEYKTLLAKFDVDKLKARNAYKRSTRQKKGRPKKINCVDSIDNPADIDSEVTIRSTRRAAQVAMVKNKTMLSINLNQKSRRPSNFNEASSSRRQKRTHIEVSSPVPPTKYRKVLNRTLAGNVNARELTENNLQSEEDLFGSTQIISNEGQNMNIPTIIDEDIEKDGENCKRSSDCIVTTTSNVTNKSDTKIPTYVDKNSTTYKQLTAVTVVPIGNCEKNKLCGSLDSGISEGASSGHHEHSNNLNIVQNKNCKENTTRPITENGNTEIEAEATANRFRTKPIKKNAVLKENDQVKNDEVEAESTNTRCRTKILKKAVVSHEENNTLDEQVEASSVINKNPDLVEDLCVPSTSRTKRKGAKKHTLCNEVVNMEKTEKELSPIRTRTKVIKKVKEEVLFEDSGALNNTKSRNINNNKMANNLIKDVTNLQECTVDKVYDNKTHDIFELPKSELVKKRIEEYEKVNMFADKNLGENGGRVTRTKTKAMRATSAFTVVDQPDATVMVQKDVLEECGKENLQSSPAPTQQGDGNNDKDKIQGTPLADYNRVKTPTVGSSNKFVVTSLSSDKHATKLCKVFLHKVPQNDMKMRQKEENVVKKQKQVDEVTKKKEKTLKAVSEQARRKREEKLKKVAAAREAAEKKKATLAMKHEEEQKEKAKQILLEKEKLKEEIAKKKLIFQQKLQEAEERRKQEEAARLAKLKEQEEEQKRLQAIREKELEAAERLNQKRQLEELRAKEAEKAKKNANLKLHKVATTNAKLKKDVKTAASSYSITPHRDERPVLKPKSENDYGIEDLQTDDSSDDESKPKKMIPLWARAKLRQKDLSIQSKFIAFEVRNMFMSCNQNPDLKALFSEEQLPRKNKPRTSSAVWTSPLTD